MSSCGEWLAELGEMRVRVLRVFFYLTMLRSPACRVIYVRCVSKRYVIIITHRTVKKEIIVTSDLEVPGSMVCRIFLAHAHQSPYSTCFIGHLKTMLQSRM
jgi:hypothetical protein